MKIENILGLKVFAVDEKLWRVYYYDSEMNPCYKSLKEFNNYQRDQLKSFNEVDKSKYITGRVVINGAY